ncbi:hypothetical protein HF295_04610 [Hujiaoplasma nucleasis]|uniref:Uncharacterized protein n=1 Tax=Hujiaoplasma nucleasis TaxID=2725268 RepID=A0A7L6N3Q5_9MOLU|nr:hypothetical protein [Hujiaoplasma nucleasis]QLY40181.1 hypothetical protein HF295_04610 [Hujiaoplasma nucleasis]
MAKKSSILSLVKNSLSKNQKLTKDENSKAIMEARFSSSGKPIKQRYEDEKKKILKNRKHEGITLKKNDPIIKKKYNHKNQTAHRPQSVRNTVTWKPKHDSIFDKINSERNKEIIIKTSRFVVENILKTSGFNLNKSELDNMSGFLSLVVSESISLMLKEEIIIGKTINAYISLGKNVYKAIVYINEKYEVSFSDKLRLANRDDIKEYEQFNIQHLDTINKYYGGLENLNQINNERNDVNYEVNGNLSNIGKYNVFSNTIAIVMKEFNQIFGSKIMNKYPLLIDNCNNVEKANCGHTPIITPVLKQILIIKLGIDDFGNEAKIIFQLAHELCHYVFYSIEGITKTMAGEEEEKLCTAMSLIVLKKLCENSIFERYCTHVKDLQVAYYRNGYFLAEELEFEIDYIVDKILKKQ